MPFSTKFFKFLTSKGRKIRTRPIYAHKFISQNVQQCREKTIESDIEMQTDKLV